MENSKLDMIISGTNDAVLMIESSANELTEDRLIEAIERGHSSLIEGIKLQEELASQVSKPKAEVPSVTINSELESKIIGFLALIIRSSASFIALLSAAGLLISEGLIG